MRKFICFFASLFFISCTAQEIKKVTIVELKTILAEENVQLLDVRTSGETSRGFIKSALFSDFFSTNFLDKAIKQLDKNKPVYLYCKSGGRSFRASKKLQEKGFNVYNVIGGYTKWKKEN